MSLQAPYSLPIPAVSRSSPTTPDRTHPTFVEDSIARSRADLGEFAQLPPTVCAAIIKVPTRPRIAVPELKQTIRYCKAANGMAIAWATFGSGPPLVVSSAGGQHLEVYFRNAVSRPWIEGLARGHTLIRYDGLGSGLSDRSIRQFSLDNAVADLEAVVEAAGATRFALFAQNWGAHAAIAYAARNPNRVERLVLYGGSVRGLFRGNPSPERLRIREASFAALRTYP